MDTVKISGTGLEVNKNGFGALPIQRVSEAEAVFLLRKAFDGGMTYFDTARFYSDSEKKVGAAFAGMRGRVILATKTMSADASGFWQQLETSLRDLRTEYIDFYQFHNPGFCPRPGDGTGLYEAMLEAKAQGKIRHIGLTNHRLPVAREAAESGLYELIQFPFNYLSSEAEIDFTRLCAARGITLVAMKALSGGLITHSRAAYAYLRGFENVLPIWGVQRERELDEFLSYVENPPTLDAETEAVIARDRAELGGDFCRGCGYCLPCPQGIEIPTCARMSLLIRRAPEAAYLADDWAGRMERIETCVLCNHCRENCPYSLDTPRLLRENLEDYRTVRGSRS
ncbi:MAG: aldo/keto reductase [Oscillospiraceae bacterium]|jgi:aryl-alcohol dehydrogenase-like predicted oxidoreductase|nr:aldo/keto reductase [Oscillospiraceae bacterium]